jgi:hypothetical protein
MLKYSFKLSRTNILLRSSGGDRLKGVIRRCSSNVLVNSQIIEPKIENTKSADRENNVSSPVRLDQLLQYSQMRTPTLSVLENIDKTLQLAAEKQAALLKRQKQVEETQLQKAFEDYQKVFQELRGMSRVTTMQRVKRMLLEWFEPLVAAIKKEREEIHSFPNHADRNVRSCVVY